MERAVTPPPGLEVLERVRAWGARALLAIAVVFAGDAAIQFVRMNGTLALEKARLERGARAAAGKRKTAADEIAAARDAAARLSLPWLELLAALESAANGEVALLSVEPDAKARTVLIVADSMDFAAALAYVKGLGASGTLTRVHLLRHERKGNAVQFSVSASWAPDEGGV